MPVQRGNYGIPPRQSAAPVQATSPRQAPMQPAMPSGPRLMDIAAPPKPNPQPPIQPQPAPRPEPATTNPAPARPVVDQIVAPPKQPLFTNIPPVEIDEQPAPTHKRGRWLPALRLTLLIMGVLLLVGGAARWITAGSTAGHIIASGAVVSNDGTSMVIQFTANDGRLHKLTAGSNDALIPGSGVQVAYRSGAVDSSAKQLAPISAARNLGSALVVSGLVLLAAGGLAALISGRHRGTSEPARPVTHPASAAV